MSDSSKPESDLVEEREAWMAECLRLARAAAEAADYAVGALVVRDGEVLARSSSQLINQHDPSAHPEMVAIRSAADAIGDRYLHGAQLVTTQEPCVMCTGAAIWAKMAGIVFGAHRSDAEEWARAHPHDLYTWRQIQISCQDVVEHGEPRLQVVGGVLRDDCKALYALTRASS